MISKTYNVREDYEPTDATTADIEDEVFHELESVSYYDKLEFFGGCPACGPYIYVTCDTLEQAKEIEKAILNAFYKTGAKRR